MTKIFDGKVVLITGGSRGLGAATARAFADEGANVAITYVESADKALAVVTELEARGVKAVAIKSDQGEPETAPALMDEVIRVFGRLDVLVNNAAVAWQGKTLDDPSIDNQAMDRQWRINVAGVIANIRAASKHLPEGGRIVSIGSGLGTRAGFPGTADYAATKAAIIGYSKGAARDLGPRKITVNVVQSGLMATDMSAAAMEAGLPPGIMELHAIQRMATVEEVAAGVLFLAGPSSSYITGSVLDVNGGYLA